LGVRIEQRDFGITPIGIAGGVVKVKEFRGRETSGRWGRFL